MATSEERIIVKLEAEVAKLHKDLNRSQNRIAKFERQTAKSVKSIKRQFDGMSSGVKRALGVFAAALGFNALKNLVSHTAQAIDSTAKFADVIGLTTEQLTGYQLAAQITGSSIGQLQTGMQRLQKNIADAEAGLATAVREFDRLGISVEQLRGLSTDEQIKLIADRFRDLPSTIDRSSVALNLFGRSGIQLSKLLDEGAQGIERFQREAVELGFAFSRLDAAKVEEANDSITRAKAVTEGFSRALTVELSPVITALSGEFIQAGKEAGGFGKLASSGIDRAARTVGVFADGLHGIELIFLGLKSAVAEFTRFIITKFNDINAGALALVNGGLSLIGVQVDSLRQAEERLRRISFASRLVARDITADFQGALLEELPSTGIEKALERARKKADEAAQAIANSVKDRTVADASGAGGVTDDKLLNDIDKLRLASLTEEQRVIAKLQEQYKQLAEAVKTGALAQEEAAEIAAGLLRNTEDRTKLTEEVDRLRMASLTEEARQIEELQMQYAKLAEAVESGVVGQDQAAAIAAGLLKNTEDVEEAADKMSEFAKQAARNMQDAFADFLFDPFKDGLDGMLKSFGQILQRMAAEAAAAQIFDALGSSFGGGGNGGSTGNFFADVGNLFFGSGKVHGGAVTAGNVYPVGESGPELFVPDVRGSIISSSELQSDRMSIGNITMSFPGINNEQEARRAAGAAGRQLLGVVETARRYS